MDAAGAGVDALAGALALLAGGGAVRFSVFAAADLTLRGVSGDCALVALAWLAGLVGAGAAAGADALEDGAAAGRGRRLPRPRYPHLARAAVPGQTLAMPLPMPSRQGGWRWPAWVQAGSRMRRGWRALAQRQRQRAALLARQTGLGETAHRPAMPQPR